MRGDIFYKDISKNFKKLELVQHRKDSGNHVNGDILQSHQNKVVEGGKPEGTTASVVSLKFFHDSCSSAHEINRTYHQYNNHGHMLQKTTMPSQSDPTLDKTARSGSARCPPLLRRGTTPGNLVLGRPNIPKFGSHTRLRRRGSCGGLDLEEAYRELFPISSLRNLSATTPNGHLSQSELIQSLDSKNEDYRGSTDSALGTDTGRRSRGRGQDLDRRPPSQNAMKSIHLSNGRVPPPLIDATREFEGVRLQSSQEEKSLHNRKGGYFKPNGLRSAFNEKISQNNSAKDDLVATGTIVSSMPNTRQLSKSLNGGAGITSAPAPLSSSTSGFGSSTRSTRLSFQRPPQSNFQRQKQTSEPKYADPLNGAEVSFQQRLAELATLEADTVRWERNRKIKKKNRDRDRDS